MNILDRRVAKRDVTNSLFQPRMDEDTREAILCGATCALAIFVFALVLLAAHA